MTNLLKFILTIIIGTAFLVSFTGCGSKKDVKEKDSKSSKKEKSKDGSNENAKNNYPDWFLTQPKAEDAIYAVGIAKKQNQQLAIDTATARARNEIARVIKIKVSTYDKRFP